MREDKRRDFIHREVSYGRFERALTLPYDVKADAIAAATYSNGVLELIIPRPDAPANRKIAVDIEGKDPPRGPVKSRSGNPAAKR